MQTIHTYVDIFGQLNNNLDRILNSFFDYIIICLCIQKEWQQLESKKSLSSATVYTNMSLLTKKTLPRNITACVVKKKTCGRTLNEKKAILYNQSIRSIWYSFFHFYLWIALISALFFSLLRWILKCELLKLANCFITCGKSINLDQNLHTK